MSRLKVYHNGAWEYADMTSEKLPTPPDTDGDYELVCTVDNGTATYEWVEISGGGQ